MLYINNLKPLRIYRKKFSFPKSRILNEHMFLLENSDLARLYLEGYKEDISSEDTLLTEESLFDSNIVLNENLLLEAQLTKGLLIFLGNSTIQENIALMNSPMFDKRYLRSYYYDFNDTEFISSRIIKTKINNQKEIFGEVKQKVPFVKKTYKKLSQYGDFNLLYDKSNIFQKINERYSTFPFKSQINILADELANQFSQSYNRPVKYVLFNMETTSVQKLSIPTLLEYCLNKNFYYILEKLPPLKFICIDDKSNKFFWFTTAQLIDKKNKPIFRRLFGQVQAGGVTSDEETEIDEKLDKPSEFSSRDKNVRKVTNEIIQRTGIIKNFTGDESGLTPSEMEVYEEIEAKVEEQTSTEVPEEIIEELDSSDEFKEYLKQVNEQKQAKVRNTRNTKRNELLKEQQRSIKVNKSGENLESIIKKAEDSKIENTTFKVKNTNPNNTVLKKDLYQSTLNDFEKNYNEKLNIPDRLKVIQSFSEGKSINLYITSIDVEDSSDEFNKKETWTVHFEDENRLRHTFTIDIPIIIDERHMYINGSKKNILKQLTFLPITKIGPNSVQVSSNYGKTFISRYGIKLSTKVERIKKVLMNTNSKVVEVLAGDNNLLNSTYLTSLEYDEFAANFMYIKNKDVEIHFNQLHIDDILASKGIVRPEDPYILPIGVRGKDIIYLDTRTNKIQGSDDDFISLITNIIEQDALIVDELEKFKIGKRYIYTRASILNNDIPVGLLVSYLVGLGNMLERANIKHYFTDKRVTMDMAGKDRENMVQFADGYLYYDAFPLTNSFLLNCFNDIDTKLYNYADFNEKEVYLEIFNNLFGTRNISKGLDNFSECFVDPITLEVLDHLNYPTNFPDILIYATRLLEDNAYTNENHMSNYRIRSNEVINAYLYKLMADQYCVYKNSSNSSNPIKMTLPKDKLIKELQMSQLVEDCDVLNPPLYLERLSATSPKGPSGLNSEEAFTLDKRVYDYSMYGIFGMSNSIASNVGINKFLTYNPRIESTRGYVLPTDKAEIGDLNVGNQLTTTEMCVPLGVNHDDPQRTSMMSTQSKHIMPLENADKLLMGTGAEKTMAQILGRDFTIKAKKDGTVIEYDENTNIMILEYKDGTHDAIDMSPKIAKNGGGGFYLSNTHTAKVKKGDSFKKDDILSINNNYFDTETTEYLGGILMKTVVNSGYYEFEDASCIREGLSEKMCTYLTMKKEIKLGPNANIDKIVKTGDKVSTGDSLLVYEHSFEDETANQLLSKVGEEYNEKISEISKNVEKSVYSGVVEDVKVYYNVPWENLSPSLQKTINSIYAPIKKKETIINKYLSSEEKREIILPPTKQTTSTDGKIHGVTVGEGVLLEIYVKYKVKVNVGDKIVFFGPLKSVVSMVVPDEQAAYTDFEPNEPVDVILPTYSVLNRLTGDLPLNLYGNKVLVYLKRKTKEIFYS